MASLVLLNYLYVNSFNPHRDLTESLLLLQDLTIVTILETRKLILEGDATITQTTQNKSLSPVLNQVKKWIKTSQRLGGG